MAACVILVSFAAGFRKSYWNGCIKAAIVICYQMENTYASFVVQSSTGTCFVQALSYKVVLGSALRKLCSTKWYWEVLFANFGVQSNTGKRFVQAL